MGMPSALGQGWRELGASVYLLTHPRSMTSRLKRGGTLMPSNYRYNRASQHHLPASSLDVIRGVVFKRQKGHGTAGVSMDWGVGSWVNPGCLTTAQNRLSSWTHVCSSVVFFSLWNLQSCRKSLQQAMKMQRLWSSPPSGGEVPVRFLSAHS